MGHVELFVGLKFTSHKVIKQAILTVSIQQHKDLIYLKNDKKKIHLRCAHCNWELTADPNIKGHSAWQIKSLQPIHSCVITFESRLITKNWLVSEYLDKILRNPRMKPIEIGCNEHGLLKKRLVGGKQQGERRRDANEHLKNKVKYIRKGIPTKCSNCGSEGHDKRKCYQPMRPTPQPHKRFQKEARRKKDLRVVRIE
ncbi:Gag polyprotein [Bienertia sinuspersici]